MSEWLPYIEVIERGRATAAHPIPLLFVHGSWHAAWCWDDHFLGYFARRGFHAAAMSLPGHGASSLPPRTKSASFADYIRAVGSTVEALGGRVVLIGHSMGALVVQKYLEARQQPAAVMLAPYPPQRPRRVVVGLRAVRRHPLRAIRLNTGAPFHSLVNTPQLARELLFSPQTPQLVVDGCTDRLEPGSRRAGTGALLVPVDSSRIATPLMVLGGLDDAAVTKSELLATSAAYGAEVHLLAHLGHDVMLETGWDEVAHKIHDWLTEHGL